ncbi:MAG TPA: IS1 family transposase [Puia sp.]|nr:IS1 family transposase [Puia sp.]
MECQYCKGTCQKAGRQKNGSQKYFCGGCKRYQQACYRKKAWQAGTESMIADLLCEGVGIRSMARILKIAVHTVLRKIRRIAQKLIKPPIRLRQQMLEVDELRTFIGRKGNEYWVAYALNSRTGEVVDFVVGKRTKGTLRMLVNTLLLSGVKMIKTDKLSLYRGLIPSSIHSCQVNGTNHIERKNLTLRTHLKRLSRKTICFSRSLGVLESCLKIYFWRKAS